MQKAQQIESIKISVIFERKLKKVENREKSGWKFARVRKKMAKFVA